MKLTASPSTDQPPSRPIVTSIVSWPASRSPPATEAAERRETSCSLEIPPPRIATFMAVGPRSAGPDAHRDRHGVATPCPDPAGGNSEITTPIWVGSVVFSVGHRGCTKPAFFSAVTAALRGCPTTLGTVIAPVEAKIVTCDPRHLLAGGRALTQDLALRLGGIPLDLGPREPRIA